MSKVYNDLKLHRFFLPPKNVLVHFLDHEILYSFGVDKKKHSAVMRELVFAFRVALLLAVDSVIMPASHFFESDYARWILKQHKIFAEFGYINLAANTLDAAVFLDQKQEQYKADSDRYPLYFTTEIAELEAANSWRWVLKERNSTTDITDAWLASIGDSSKWEDVYRVCKGYSVAKFEHLLRQVPEQLEKDAFIADFVTPLLPIEEKAQRIANKKISILIQRAYIDSFLESYMAACLDDLTLFDTSILLPLNKPRYSVARAKRYFYKKELLAFVNFSTAKDFLKYRLSEDWARELGGFCKFIRLNFEDSGTVDSLPVLEESHGVRGGYMDHNQKRIEAIEAHLNECVEYLDACYRDTLGGAVLQLSAKKKIQDINLLISQREAELLSLVGNLSAPDREALVKNLSIVRNPDTSESDKLVAKSEASSALSKIRDKIIDIGGQYALQLILRSVGIDL